MPTHNSSSIAAAASAMAKKTTLLSLNILNHMAGGMEERLIYTVNLCMQQVPAGQNLSYPEALADGEILRSTYLFSLQRMHASSSCTLKNNHYIMISFIRSVALLRSTISPEPATARPAEGQPIGFRLNFSFSTPQTDDGTVFVVPTLHPGTELTKSKEVADSSKNSERGSTDKLLKIYHCDKP